MEDLTIVISRLLIALFAGGLIGLERAYTGRPAGLRTHALVCMASSLLMLLTVFQWELLANAPLDTVRVDPTRMAQGVMTGIGFLGAGVIMKEKFTIRGLTTAASIWITASIGIILGMGFYTAGLLATALTLAILSFFGWLEKRIPSRVYSKLVVRFKTRSVMKQHELNEFIKQFKIRGSNPSYKWEEDGRYLEYRMNLATSHANNYQLLADHLANLENVHEFTIVPISD
jgi:putative Mg2+ transporter-C (MgtC) family protein